MLAWRGVTTCLVNSFRASRRGWIRPKNVGLLGPTRSIKNPITFRSNKVKKATDSIIRRHWSNQDKRISIRQRVSITTKLVLKTKIFI